MIQKLTNKAYVTIYVYRFPGAWYDGTWYVLNTVYTYVVRNVFYFSTARLVLVKHVLGGKDAFADKMVAMRSQGLRALVCLVSVSIICTGTAVSCVLMNAVERSMAIECNRRRRGPCQTTPYYIMQCHAISYHTKPCHAILYHIVPCHTIPYHTIPYHAIPYHTIQCHRLL